jgi:uncharacterized RDD family membrane protein YckC
VGTTLQYAGFWRRAAAVAIDSLIWLVLLVPIAGVSGLFGAHAAPSESEALSSGLLNLGINALSWGVTALCWVKWRATPGKWAMGLEVLDATTGDNISWGRAIWRYFAYLFSSIPLGLGYLWVVFYPRKQGFHDKLANTIVVHRRKAVPVQSVPVPEQRTSQPE